MSRNAGCTPGAGWLYKDLTIQADNHGVFVPRYSIFEQAPFPTRTEEYKWVSRTLEFEWRGVVFDMGCGFNRDIHLLPYILGNMGFRVHALDPQLNRPGFPMPTHWNVFWSNESMDRTGWPAECADYWLSVSVMEHVDLITRDATFKEAKRLLKPGGHVLLTTDEMPPAEVNEWLSQAGFETGEVWNGVESDLTPRVAWAIARKPK